MDINNEDNNQDNNDDRRDENAVQPPRNQPARRYPYSTTTLLTNLSHVRPITSALEAEQFGRFCDRRNMGDRVTLQQLIQMPDADYCRSWLIALVVAIPRARNNGQSTMYRRNGNQRGNATNIQYTRSLRLMDPMSPPGMNIFTILEGYGFGDRLFNLDITKRDNGTFRK